MPVGDNPTSQLRRLRTELRQRRDTARLTQREVADALDWSPSKLIRIERGPVGISVTDVRALLQHYRVTDEQQVETLVDLARASKKPAWWHQYRDQHSAQFITFLGLEASSVRIQQYQGLMFPGLLQHPDYTRALVVRTDDVERIVTIRQTRQKLIGEDGPEMSFILDEAVLHRVIGSPAVMRTQLHRLIEQQSQPNVTIRVLPYSIGVHDGMKGSFTILDLSDEEDDYALQLEQAFGDRLFEETSDETREYVQIFQQLKRIALSPDDSMVLIEKVLATVGEES
jgi:transcriptional regulator with XRE-family HTH domain